MNVDCYCESIVIAVAEAKRDAVEGNFWRNTISLYCAIDSRSSLLHTFILKPILLLRIF